jgi:hypothetical protein
MSHYIQKPCKSLETFPEFADSDISAAKISPICVEIYPAVSKTISISLPELKALVKEIEEYANVQLP